MNKEKQISQFRLATDVFEKMLPWEMLDRGKWRDQGSSSRFTPIMAVANGFEIRIKPSAFPPSPEGEEWHNPHGLTPEQVGIADGWRLALRSEIRDNGPLYGKCSGWLSIMKKWSTDNYGGNDTNRTYRTREPLPPVIPENFTPWHGGDKAPVSGKVEVLFKNGHRHIHDARVYNWTHTDRSRPRSTDIIAYRSLSVPWSGPEDVPGPVCWMREKGYTDKHAGMVVYLFDNCMDIAGRGRVRYSDLHKFEHSTDRVNWKECVK